MWVNSVCLSVGVKAPASVSVDDLIRVCVCVSVLQLCLSKVFWGVGSMCKCVLKMDSLEFKATVSSLIRS